jgi:hypothetical protein
MVEAVRGPDAHPAESSGPFGLFHLSRANGPTILNECNRELVLKNSVFLKTAKIWRIENV